MAQTQLDYNSLMFGVKDQPFRYKTKTITGAVDLLAGTVLVKSAANTYISAVDASKALTGAVDAGWAILLEDAAVTGGDTSSKIGISGGVAEDKLIAGTGLTIDDLVIGKLEINNIFVQSKTNSMAVAGEGA